MPGRGAKLSYSVRFVVAVVVGSGLFLGLSENALAISAPIHIANTGGEGVNIRAEPNAGSAKLGWMPEGTSPDYNCFAWGQVINGVPIWFSVNYGGVTGYYASYYDDSSYHSNEELTAKYGVPLCGSAPPPSPAPEPPPNPPETPSLPSVPGPPPGGSTESTKSPPVPAAIYFSPFGHGTYEAGAGVTTLSIGTWGSQCVLPALAYSAATATLVPGQTISTLAGWSYGRVGTISFLANAGAHRAQVSYAVMIDPGAYSELGCDRVLHAGDVLATWLKANPSAHLVVISGSLSQSEKSRGIQEAYFNGIRNAGGNLRSRVLTCNYSISHTNAFLGARYWIQHQIGSSTSSCPWLNPGRGTYKPTAGWHP
jgi:hypothetical protein